MTCSSKRGFMLVKILGTPYTPHSFLLQKKKVKMLQPADMACCCARIKSFLLFSRATHQHQTLSQLPLSLGPECLGRGTFPGWRRKLAHCKKLKYYDDDDDDDTQRSPSNSRQRPGLTGVSVGVLAPRKNLLGLVRLALLTRLVLTHG